MGIRPVAEYLLTSGRTQGRGKDGEGEFEVPFAHVWQLDGVPDRLQGYLDSAPILAALTRTG